MAEFWRQRIIKIENEIVYAEMNGEFNKVVNLMTEKAKCEKRLKEIEDIKQ